MAHRDRTQEVKELFAEPRNNRKRALMAYLTKVEARALSMRVRGLYLTEISIVLCAQGYGMTRSCPARIGSPKRRENVRRIIRRAYRKLCAAIGHYDCKKNIRLLFRGRLGQKKKDECISRILAHMIRHRPGRANRAGCRRCLRYFQVRDRKCRRR